MKQRGFTLIETVVYIGLFSVLMSGGIVTLYALLTSIENNRSALATFTEMQFVNQKLAWALSGASEVNVLNSSTLEIIRSDLGLESPLVISVENKQFYLTRGEESKLVLTGADFPVSEAIFEVNTNLATLQTEVTLHYYVKGIPFRYRTYLHSPL